jgi:hypothetical protein
LWETEKSQRLEIQADGVVWDAYWIPIGPDQEALNNVNKHARASQVAVTQEVDQDTVRLIISDNGTGAAFGYKVAGGVLRKYNV